MSAQTPESLRFLALGDSYTIGEGVSAGERWPVQLVGFARARGVMLSDPVIVARTGWTTDELSAAIDAADPRGPFALVTLLIGVNNQYRGRNSEEYREHFRGLVSRSVALAGADPKRVVVLSIPDWSVTPFAKGRDPAGISRAIERFNEINREEALRAGARYVDVMPSSRRAASDLTLLAADGLHPSGAMYSEWAELALPEVLAAVSNVRGR